MSGGPWQEYPGEFRLEDLGVYELEYYSTDNADNIEKKHRITLEVLRELQVGDGDDGEDGEQLWEYIMFLVIFLIIVVIVTVAAISRKRKPSKPS